MPENEKKQGNNKNDEEWNAMEVEILVRSIRTTRFVCNSLRAVSFGIGSLLFLGPNIWKKVIWDLNHRFMIVS